MHILRMPLGQMQTNAYMVYCKETMEGIIIDPGASGEYVVNQAKEHGIKLKYIVLTHGHGDHIGGVDKIKELLEIPVIAFEKEKEVLNNPTINLSPMLGMGDYVMDADIYIDESYEIEFGNLKGKVYHTPGHTVGGMTIRIGEALFTGDTIFKGSIGRTDFPGGNHSALLNSIHSKIMVLDDDLTILSGHGEITSVGEERVSNPFI